MSKEMWAQAAAKIIKAEISKRNLTYKELVSKLKELGIEETEGSVKVKLARGTFSAIFFLQCLRSLGIKNLSLDDVFFAD